MRWYDRLALILLGGLLVRLVASLFFLGNQVADLDDRPQQIDIQDAPEPTTVPEPRTCVVSGADTNWAARFGVPDQAVCT